MSVHCRNLIAMAAVVVLPACGGNPLDLDEAAPFGPISTSEAEGLANSYDRLSDRVLGLSPTSDLAMDDSGQATFTGMARINITPETAADSMTLVGDATLRVDFGEGLVTAQMINFAGPDMNGNAQRLDGSLDMDAGRIGFAQANGISGTFFGTLLAQDFEVTARGVLEGTFRDSPTTAVSFSGLDDTASLNGERARLTLTGIAQE